MDKSEILEKYIIPILVVVVGGLILTFLRSDKFKSFSIKILKYIFQFIPLKIYSLIALYWKYFLLGLLILILEVFVYIIFQKWEVVALSIIHLAVFILIINCIPILFDENKTKKPISYSTSGYSSNLIFYDGFEKESNWGDIGKGKVSRSNDIAYRGKYSLKKELNSDHHGGYKTMERTIGRGLLFSGFIYRPSKFRGGDADRLAIEGQGFSGYVANVITSSTLFSGTNRFTTLSTLNKIY